jgi:hypothetical protein
MELTLSPMGEIGFFFFAINIIIGVDERSIWLGKRGAN